MEVVEVLVLAFHSQVSISLSVSPPRVTTRAPAPMRPVCLGINTLPARLGHGAPARPATARGHLAGGLRGAAGGGVSSAPHAAALAAPHAGLTGVVTTEHAVTHWSTPGHKWAAEGKHPNAGPETGSQDQNPLD